MTFSRRQFLCSVGTAALSASFMPARTSQAEIQIGYSAITWGDKLDQAIDEIAELGYRGIQIGQPNYAKYAQRASEFRALLAAKHLTLVSIATDNVTIKPETEKQEIAGCLALAKWMKESGGQYLQVTDNVRSGGYKPGPDDYKKLGRRLTELGKRTFGEHGIKLGYRNRLNTLGEGHGEVDRILAATDPKAVWVMPDIAHIRAAQGDELKFLRDYITRLGYPCFKDVRISQVASQTLDGSRVSAKYTFVEVGQGQVNVPGAFQLLKDFRYQGWIIIELEQSPAGRTPKESAAISKRFVEEKLKLKI